MRVVVAPGSYKSTILSKNATDAIARAVENDVPGADVETLVLADGGEGTLETFAAHFDSVTVSQRIHGPLGRMTEARLSFLEESVALIESAQALGLSLIKPTEKDPFIASSYGVGELIRYAVDRGASKVMVSMGDSATMDMGVGMLDALGVKFYSASGRRLEAPTLRDFHKIAELDDADLDALRARVMFVGLVDTNDYLCGEIGQVQLYGRQKGLKDLDIPVVESAFVHFAEVIQKRFGIDVTRVIRATGSGGLGAALHAFLAADLLNTLDYLAARLPLDEIIRAADITITGEGCLDKQTRLGKVPYFVAARSTGRCIGIVGSYTQEGLIDMQSVCERFLISTMNPELARSDPARALCDVVSSLAPLIKESR